MADRVARLDDRVNECLVKHLLWMDFRQGRTRVRAKFRYFSKAGWVHVSGEDALLALAEFNLVGADVALELINEDLQSRGLPRNSAQSQELE